MFQQNSTGGGPVLEQTEIPPELFLPFRGLSSTPLFFSDYCRKLTTHRGVTITRVIICTCEHFYLCHPNGDILRCFPYTAISRILHDELRHQVGIVVPCEFDLAVETPLSFQLIRVIDVLRRMHGARTQLELIRVESVPRPEGFLGLRPDGSTIWDPHVAKHRKIKNDQSCTEQVLGACGLQDAWIACKDSCYRYYRRVMRSLDLGIEDDDEVLTNTTAMSTAMMANNANAKPDGANAVAGGGKNASGGDGSANASVSQFTVMLAAGKTSFAFALNNNKSFASKANIMDGNNNNGETGGVAKETATEDSMGVAADALPSGYRWFRPTEEDLKKKKRLAEDEKNGARRSAVHQRSGRQTNFSDDPQDNEVLNILFSPLLNEEEDDGCRVLKNNGDDDEIIENDLFVRDNDNDDEELSTSPTVAMSPRVMGDDRNRNNSPTSAAMSETARKQKEMEKKNRNQWWPGCQVGWTDGPYALSLAKPKGFKVALDQRNSEFV